MLAVKADYQAGKVVVGTRAGEPVPKDQILAQLKSIGYKGAFIE